MITDFFEPIEYNGSLWQPRVICCQSRAEASANLVRKLTDNPEAEVIWLPINEKNLDGQICVKIHQPTN